MVTKQTKRGSSGRRPRAAAVKRGAGKAPRLPKRRKDEPLMMWIMRAAEAMPEDERRNLPVDGAEQHDHYIYGTPKR